MSAARPGWRVLAVPVAALLLVGVGLGAAPGRASALLPWPTCETATDPPQKVVSMLETRLSTWCTSMIPRPLLMTAEHGVATIDAHGRVSYRSEPEFRGVDTIWAVVTIGDRSSMYRTGFEVEVVGPAAARPDVYAVPAGIRFESPVSLLANDEVPTEGWLIQQGSTPPALGTIEIDTVTGSFVYTPRPGAAGVDTIRYRLTGPDDGAYSNAVTVTLEVG